MKPAQRIPLLKKLATALSSEDMPWADMTLTLRQFGFSAEDVWGEDEWGNDLGPSRYGFALHHLENSGDDEKLLELERYLDPSADQQGPPSSTDPGPWKTKTSFRLFISHTHPNAKLAAGIKAFLGKSRIECFVAHNDIAPSEKWREVIRTALLTTHAMTALVTDDFRTSEWCDQEVGFALARSMLVVPVMCDNARPHGFLGEFQAIKLKDTKSAWTPATKIFSIMAKHKETRDRMAGPIVRRYAKSHDFNEISSMYSLMTHIPKDAWTNELVKECKQAAIDNVSIKKAKTTPKGTSITSAVAKLLTPIEQQLGMGDADIPF
jgi:hypothetical protein